MTALLNFQTPRGLRLTLSALASPNFATSYQLGTVGVVDGSISYLFSSVPLRVLLTPQSETVPLPDLLRSYRPLTPLSPAEPPLVQSLQGIGRPQASLLYGRLYLPQSQLEGLIIRRLSESLQVQVSAVSAQHLRNGGTVLGVAQYDVGRYAVEALASTDSGLLGLRGVYNFGGDAEHITSPGKGKLPAVVAEMTNGEKERIYGRFSTGAEIYYGTLNKSGGISLATRFATLPSHKGTPLAATLTLNPLMGSIGASYAVVAGKHCSLATRMEFNVFSYESAWAVGMELWRKPFSRPEAEGNGSKFNGSINPQDYDGEIQEKPKYRERSFRAKMEWRLDPEPELRLDAPKEGDADIAAVPAEGQAAEPIQDLHQPGWKQADEYAGVLKARLDQNLRIGILWQGRVKSLLFSLGSAIDLRHLDKPFRTVGLEVQFSS